MFKLSEKQKYDLITILKDLALHDRNFNSLESVRIRMAGLKMDLQAAKIDEALYEDTESLENVLEKLSVFQTEEEKKFTYQQCLLLLMADREISEGEKEALSQIQTALNIDQSTHQALLQWVQEGMDWEKKGEQIVGGQLGI